VAIFRNFKIKIRFGKRKKKHRAFMTEHSFSEYFCKVVKILHKSALNAKEQAAQGGFQVPDELATQ
jgi:hypothetical protein